MLECVGHMVVLMVAMLLIGDWNGVLSGGNRGL